MVQYRVSENVAMGAGGLQQHMISTGSLRRTLGAGDHLHRVVEDVIEAPEVERKRFRALGGFVLPRGCEATPHRREAPEQCDGAGEGTPETKSPTQRVKGVVVM
jgi:hypothetical protein